MTWWYDLNSGPHAYTTSTLPAEFAKEPLISVWLHIQSTSTVVFGLNVVITVSRSSVWSFSVFTLSGKYNLVTVTLLMPCLLILTSMAARFVISFYKPMRHANFWLWTNYSLATVMRRGSWLSHATKILELCSGKKMLRYLETIWTFLVRHLNLFLFHQTLH